MPGKFVVRHRQGGQFHCVLVAENRQVVATSETYTTKRRCLEGIESVKGLRPTRRWMTRRRSRRLGRRRSGFNSRHLRRASAAAGRSRGARRRGGRYRPRPVKTISAVSTTWPESRICRGCKKHGTLLLPGEELAWPEADYGVAVLTRRERRRLEHWTRGSGENAEREVVWFARDRHQQVDGGGTGIRHGRALERERADRLCPEVDGRRAHPKNGGRRRGRCGERDGGGEKQRSQNSDPHLDTSFCGRPSVHGRLCVWQAVPSDGQLPQGAVSIAASRQQHVGSQSRGDHNTQRRATAALAADASPRTRSGSRSRATNGGHRARRRAARPVLRGQEAPRRLTAPSAAGSKERSRSSRASVCSRPRAWRSTTPR
jgi:uncharacterized protein YegP (UPF0339 family)